MLRLDEFMGDHVYDIHCGAVALVSDYYANKDNPYRKLVGGWIHSDTWEKLRGVPH